MDSLHATVHNKLQPVVRSHLLNVKAGRWVGRLSYSEWTNEGVRGGQITREDPRTSPREKAGKGTRGEINSLQSVCN